MLFSDFRAHGPISILTPPITALTEFFHAVAVASIHPLPVSWYLISSLWLYRYFCMHIMSMLWSIADAVSSGSCPILFKVLTLNVTICIVHLHFSNFYLSSVADFLNTEASRTCPFFTRVKSKVVWVWVMVIFWQLFLFSSIEATLTDEQQLFSNRTIWSWPLNCKIHTPRTWLGISLNHQRVYLLAFMSTMLLSMAFKKNNLFFPAPLSSPFYHY